MTARRAGIFVLGLVLVMSPWWVRNARIYGRFVPTALWMGASLYDGLNSRATGASDMSFLADPEIWPLDEQDQDAELTRRALAFAGEYPARRSSLALVKLRRFWSPWPNAVGFRFPALAVCEHGYRAPAVCSRRPGSLGPQARSARLVSLPWAAALFLCAPSRLRQLGSLSNPR